MTEVPSSTAASEVRCIHCGDAHPPSYAHCPKTGKDITAGEALVGRVIAGKYKVVGVLGEGGMGAVYVAEHLLLGRMVAIKRLHPELAAEEKSVRRFQREARAAGATGHAHIVDVLDMGYTEEGAPFLVMEYLQGESLAQVLRREGRLAPPRACHLLGQALDALAAVHAKGIVHRDLKPDNLFLTRRSGRVDYVKVLDFGVSKVRREDGEPFEMTLTRTGVMVGTPYYMSPEQARGMKLHDHRVDLYAAGVILYQCLSGRMPFEADNYHALLQAILRGQPPRVEQLTPGLDPALADVVHRAIALDPTERFGSAVEMLEALVPFGAVAPSEQAAASLRATQPYPGHPPSPTPPAGAAAPDGRTPPPAASAGRAPAPRQLAALPRPFDARSEDWAEDDLPALALESDGPAPLPATAPPSNPPAPIHPAAREAPGPEGPIRIKGALLAAALEHLRTARGEAVRQAVVDELPDDVRAAVLGVVLPVAWVPLDHYDVLLRTAERLLGTGDGSLAIELGAAAADAELPATHRLFLQSATPLLAVRRIPQLFRSYHDGGAVSVRPSTRDAWHVEVEGLEPQSRLHPMAMAGFYRRLIELAGGRDVRATVVTTAAPGKPTTVTSVRWR
ncbi:MAG: protein kinase domain-containing protein [Myxococcota bacterium]